MKVFFLLMHDIYNSLSEYTQKILDFFAQNLAWPEWMPFDAPSFWPTISVAELIFGGGLIFFLTWIIIKFFTDIIF